MKTIKIGRLEFNIKECRRMSRKAFYKSHQSICDRLNVDIGHVFERVSGKKAPSVKKREE